MLTQLVIAMISDNLSSAKTLTSDLSQGTQVLTDSATARR